MDPQTLIDTLNAAGERDRASYHLTLGEAIELLAGLPQDARVVCDFDPDVSPQECDSYRGFYSDLAFEAGPVGTTAGALKGLCEEALGSAFDGYKGGEYTMHEKTPLWVSPYGESSGIAVIGISMVDDVAVLATKQTKP